MTRINCLTYLLNIWQKGQRFIILYNGDHTIGDDKGLIFDFDYKQRGDINKYIPLEKCHEKETIKKIFNLDENYSKIIDEYFAYVKNS